MFDYPSIGVPPGLTWIFDFQFAEVSRDYGDSPVSLTLDWVEGAGWAYDRILVHIAYLQGLAADA